MSINTKILELKSALESNGDNINDYVKQWLNVEEADVDSEGDIWVNIPCVGHWLKPEKKQEFIEWLESL